MWYTRVTRGCACILRNGASLQIQTQLLLLRANVVSDTNSIGYKLSRIQTLSNTNALWYKHYLSTWFKIPPLSQHKCPEIQVIYQLQMVSDTNSISVQILQDTSAISGTTDLRYKCYKMGAEPLVTHNSFSSSSFYPIVN